MSTTTDNAPDPFVTSQEFGRPARVLIVETDSYSGGLSSDSRFSAIDSFPTKRQKGRRPTANPTSKVLRRLKGFIIEFGGRESRVAFVNNGEIVEYDLPSNQLREAGIIGKNQPFQMDEIQVRSPDGGVMVAYRFTALAAASAAYSQVLKLDAKLTNKRDIILKNLG